MNIERIEDRAEAAIRKVLHQERLYVPTLISEACELMLKDVVRETIWRMVDEGKVSITRTRKLTLTEDLGD